MKNIPRYITPLRLAAVYIIVAAVWLIIVNKNDNSVIGWAYTFATVMVLAAISIIGIEYVLKQFLNKAPLYYWIAQFVLFSILLWIFFRVGLPGSI